MSTLNKISLDGTVYDIGGGNANVYDIYIDTGELYYSYTCVDPDALEVCTKILASLSSGKPAFVFLKNKNNAFCQGLCAKEPITVTPGTGGTVEFTGWASTMFYSPQYQSGYSRAKIDRPNFGFRYNEQGEATGIMFYFASADIKYIPTDGSFGTAFNPTQPYHPATKKYVDDLIPTQTILTDTLTAGNTTLTFTDSSILTSSLIDVYTDTFGVNPTNMTSSTGELILTFPAQTDDVDVKVVIR